jgi:hypothetical protein
MSFRLTGAESGSRPLLCARSPGRSLLFALRSSLSFLFAVAAPPACSWYGALFGAGAVALCGALHGRPAGGRLQGVRGRPHSDAAHGGGGPELDGARPVEVASNRLARQASGFCQARSSRWGDLFDGTHGWRACWRLVSQWIGAFAPALQRSAGRAVLLAPDCLPEAGPRSPFRDGASEAPMGALVMRPLQAETAPGSAISSNRRGLG